MVRRLRSAGVAGVAIERGDGPVVEELLGAGLAVFVVPSRQIKGLRTRYGSAGNKDDRFDAYVLADTLRTDGHRWKPLRPDTGPTRALRALCRSRKDLVQTRVQVLGQLRANLELAFPGAIGLFTKPASGISLAFLRRFPTAGKAAWLSPGADVGVAAVRRVYRRHQRRGAARPADSCSSGTDGAEGEARGQITLAFAAMPAALNEQIAVLDAEIGRALRRASRPAHLRQPAPFRDRARRHPARRDRRLQAAIPHRRRARRAGRGLPLDAPVRQAQPGGVPLVVQQETPRRRHGLRQRQPHVRPVGRRDLRRRDRPRLPSSARHPDPGPRLDPHHLALLARRHRLRSCPSPRPPRRRCLT